MAYIPRKFGGNFLPVRDANRLADSIRDVRDEPTRRLIQGQRPQQGHILAKIVTAGPNKEANYTDERYWCQPQYIKGATSVTDKIVFADNKNFKPTIFTVSNLPEQPARAHGLAANAIVRIWQEWDRGNPANRPRWVMDEAPSPFVQVVVNGPDTGMSYGYYNATLVTGGPAATIDTTVALTSIHFGEFAPTPNCFVENAAEMNCTSWQIPNGSLMFGKIIGTAKNGPSATAQLPNTTAPLIRVCYGGFGIPFLVKLVQVGGAGGGVGTQATWTYDIYNIDDVPAVRFRGPVATARSPLKPRANGATAPALWGLAANYGSSGGGLVLLIAYEDTE